jgi:hypothetical protein
MKKKFSVLAAGLFMLAMMAFVPKATDQKPWPVPDAAKNKVNPLKGDAASLATGKALYNQHPATAQKVKEMAQKQRS